MACWLRGRTTFKQLRGAKPQVGNQYHNRKKLTPAPQGTFNSHSGIQDVSRLLMTGSKGWPGVPGNPTLVVGGLQLCMCGASRWHWHGDALTICGSVMRPKRGHLCAARVML